MASYSESSRPSLAIHTALDSHSLQNPTPVKQLAAQEGKQSSRQVLASSSGSAEEDRVCERHSLPELSDEVAASETDLTQPEDPGEDSGSNIQATTGSSSRADYTSAPIVTLELLSEGGFYDMPMAKAARILGRTEGSFQRVCRGLGILRWPYRVRKSLKAIMAKTEQYLDADSEEDGLSKAEVLEVLQAHMDDIKGISGTGMDKATKQYRQYIFKLNHKLARKAERLGLDPTSDASAVKAKGMLRAASRIQKSQPRLGGKQSTKERKRLSNSKTAKCINAPKPTRPTPRHFKDLPASLAFSPLGQGERGDIVGTMATCAAFQSRLRSSTAPSELQTASQDCDEELQRLCVEMHARLQAAQNALALRNPVATCTFQQQDSSSAYVQQLLNASVGYGQAQMYSPYSSDVLRSFTPGYWQVQ